MVMVGVKIVGVAVAVQWNEPVSATFHWVPILGRPLKGSCTTLTLQMKDLLLQETT